MSVPDLGTILSVWAHPDDESYCCAGLMAEAIRQGHRVVCVTATRGEQGSSDPDRWPPGPELAAIRTEELAASLAEIGVTEHIWLDYPDGGCADVDPAEAVARIKEIADELQPDVALCFGPDGATYHPDHIATSNWTTAAIEGTDTQLLYTSVTRRWLTAMEQFVGLDLLMMTDDPPLVHDPADLAVHAILEGDLLEMKYRAMLCQESQIGPLLNLVGEQMYREMLADETFRDGTLRPWQ